MLTVPGQQPARGPEEAEPTPQGKVAVGEKAAQSQNAYVQNKRKAVAEKLSQEKEKIEQWAAAPQTLNQPVVPEASGASTIAELSASDGRAARNQAGLQSTLKWTLNRPPAPVAAPATATAGPPIPGLDADASPSAERRLYLNDNVVLQQPSLPTSTPTPGENSTSTELNDDNLSPQPPDHLPQRIEDAERSVHLANADALLAGTPQSANQAAILNTARGNVSPERDERIGCKRPTSHPRPRVPPSENTLRTIVGRNDTTADLQRRRTTARQRAAPVELQKGRWPSTRRRRKTEQTARKKDQSAVEADSTTMPTCSSDGNQ